MSERRSSRAYKKVDYSRLGRDDEDNPYNNDDDDFAEPTPPPSKKIKKESKKKAQSKSNQANKERVSLNERVFDRELQLALEISAHQLQPEHVFEQHAPPAQQTHNINSPPLLKKITDDEKENGERITSNVAVITDDCAIEVLDSDVKEAPKNGRQLQKTKYNFNDSDSDSDEQYQQHEQESSSGSEDEFDPDDDDFGSVKNKTKSKKHAAKTKNYVQKPTTVSSSITTKKKTLSAQKATVLTAAVSTVSCTPPISKSSGITKRKWNPPAGTNETTSSLQSPTSGLRLGLSRNVRTKPLHSNVKVPH